MKTLSREEILQLPKHPLGVCSDMRLVIEDFYDFWAGIRHEIGESYCTNYIGSENVVGKGLCKGRIIHKEDITFFQCNYNSNKFPIVIPSSGESTQ